MGFFGFMRAGEFTVKSPLDFDPAVSLTLQDISVDRHSDSTMICIHLKQSKTDPFRHGVDIFLGRTGSGLCPVSAVLAYIAIRREVAGPLFMFSDSSPLTRTKLISAVQRALAQAGFDTAGYTGHSFRIGAATTAAQAGIEDSVIKMLGRWESGAYHRYLRTPRDTLAAVSCQLIGGRM